MKKMSTMCTLYYRQLQVDNQELTEKVEILESIQTEDSGPSVPSLQKDVFRLREDKRELEMRVRQLEAENRAFAYTGETRARKSEVTELPPVARGERVYEPAFRMVAKSPAKGRQSTHRSEPRRREEPRQQQPGVSKREAIEALSQLLLNRAAYAKAQK